MNKQRVVPLMLAIASCVGWAVVGTASAQPPGGPPNFPGRGGPPRPGELFERFDTNEDGKLGKDEVPATMWRRLMQADTDKDEQLSKDEMTAVMRRLAAARPDRDGDSKSESSARDEGKRPAADSRRGRVGPPSGRGGPPMGRPGQPGWRPSPWARPDKEPDDSAAKPKETDSEKDDAAAERGKRDPQRPERRSDPALSRRDEGRLERGRDGQYRGPGQSSGPGRPGALTRQDRPQFGPSAAGPRDARQNAYRRAHVRRAGAMRAQRARQSSYAWHRFRYQPPQFSRYFFAMRARSGFGPGTPFGQHPRGRTPGNWMGRTPQRSWQGPPADFRARRGPQRPGHSSMPGPRSWQGGRPGAESGHGGPPMRPDMGPPPEVVQRWRDMMAQRARSRGDRDRSADDKDSVRGRRGRSQRENEKSQDAPSRAEKEKPERDRGHRDHEAESAS